MKLKQLFSVLLLIAALFSLTACGDEVEVYTHEDLVLGTIEADNTTCTYTAPIGIVCTLDTNWKLTVGEQQNELTGTLVDMNDPASISRALNLGRPIYELYALGDTGASLSVCLEDMRVVCGGVITAEEYIRRMEKPTRQQLEILGMQNLEVSAGSVDFAGSTHYAIHTVGDLMNAKVYETQVFITQGNYLYTITVTCYNKDIRSETLALFSAA